MVMKSKDKTFRVCSLGLFPAAKRSNKFLYSVSHMACALADCASWGEKMHVMKLTMCMASIMETAFVFRQNFFTLFEEHKRQDVDEYTTFHRNRDYISSSPSENWLSQALRTREIFPGRPQVRLGLSFGLSSRRLNPKASVKITVSLKHTHWVFLRRNMYLATRNILEIL